MLASITARPLASIGDENASGAPAFFPGKECAMCIRQRFKKPFQERLSDFIADASAKAGSLPDGRERDDLLNKIDTAHAAANLYKWANSPGLQSPKK
ncbi:MULTISPECIES: hypothetical protein [unclassified Nitrobacter]|nr:MULTISPECIES: hypothetical protein [unclassified Nitrobacter]